RQHPDRSQTARWFGCSLRERVSAVSFRWSFRGPASRVRQEARLHPFAFGLRRFAALWCDGLVGRCAERLDDVCAADSGWVELLHIRESLLDYRYWRIYLRRQLERS